MQSGRFHTTKWGLVVVAGADNDDVGVGGPSPRYVDGRRTRGFRL